MLKRAIVAVTLGAAIVLPRAALAQAGGGDSTTSSSPHYARILVLGATTSIALHELAHVTAALALGGRPTFAFNELRPTIYSGINARTDPHKQFLFSSAGLDVQNVLDEAILDIPHSRGSAFERGLLAGGIGTTIFYLTLGRTGSVSDIDYIARTHAMTKTQATLLYGTIAGSHIWRMSRDAHYADFFVRARGGSAQLGLAFGAPLPLRHFFGTILAPPSGRVWQPQSRSSPKRRSSPPTTSAAPCPWSANRRTSATTAPSPGTS